MIGRLIFWDVYDATSCPHENCSYHKAVKEQLSNRTRCTQDNRIRELADKRKDKSESSSALLEHPMFMMSSSTSKSKMGKVKWFSPIGQ